jgi:hypothetical protein
VLGFDIRLILISMNLEIRIGTPAGALHLELISDSIRPSKNEHHLVAEAKLPNLEF